MLNEESDVTNYASDLCEEDVEENNTGATLEELCEGERHAIDSLLNLGSIFVNFRQNYHIEDEGDQVTGGDLVASFTSKIENNKHLESLTGLCSFKLLNYICSLVERHYLTVHTHKLSIQDRVVLVFFKLKTAIKFNVMASFFHISPSTCRETFNEYVQYIANVLKPCILWPSIEKSRANMPKSFKDYNNVRGIFDCMEIPVQEPRCRSCQIKTYSHYRRRNTLKFMICVSPGGLLTFISKGYGGRTSDKSIFEQSGVINKFEPYIDTIMVDKGFLVDELCAGHSIKIERPFFHRKDKQFSSVRVKKNATIARARFHVERAHQCIRTFEIFNAILPWNVVPYIDSIFTIVCSIVNLQTKSRREYILKCSN
jgi:molybdopterin converting factor small subunit